MEKLRLGVLDFRPRQQSGGPDRGHRGCSLHLPRSRWWFPNRPEAPGLALAIEAGLPAIVVNHRGLCRPRRLRNSPD